MDDLISRAAAIKAVEEYLQGLDSCISEDKLKLDGYRNGLQVAMYEVNNAPAVDAAPVVRCRDCKYGEPETNGRGEDMVMCQNKLNPIGYEDWLMPPEFFCADGERRESE